MTYLNTLKSARNFAADVLSGARNYTSALDEIDLEKESKKDALLQRRNINKGKGYETTNDFITEYYMQQRKEIDTLKENSIAVRGMLTDVEYDSKYLYKPNADRTGPPLSDNQMVDKIILSIREVESSGGTNTNHKQVKTGMYAGQTAIGEWAIMPGNIDPTLNTKGTKSKKDSWINFKEFKEMFPKITADAKGLELLKNNTKAQRLIVKNQVTKNLNRTSDPAEVASIWFTGKKRKDAGKVKDDTGTTLPTYLSKFNSAMGEL